MSEGSTGVEGDLFPSGNERLVGASAFIAASVAVVYPLAMILYAFVGGAVLQIGSSLAGAAVFFLMCLRPTRMGRVKKMIMVLMVFSLFIWGWYGAFWTGMRSYGVILVFFSCLGVAWAALQFGISKYVYEYPFIIFLAVT